MSKRGVFVDDVPLVVGVPFVSDMVTDAHVGCWCWCYTEKSAGHHVAQRGVDSLLNGRAAGTGTFTDADFQASSERLWL